MDKQEIHDAYRAYVESDAPTTNESWQITDDAVAIWALRKMALAKQAIAAREEVVGREVDALRAWLKASTQADQDDLRFFEGKLHGYLLALQEAGQLGKKKSHALPNGRLQLRHVDALYDVVDAPALQAWAEALGHCDMIPTPNMPLIRTLCAGGVNVPGMALKRPAGESFSVHLPREQEGNDGLSPRRSLHQTPQEGQRSQDR